MIKKFFFNIFKPKIFIFTLIQKIGLLNVNQFLKINFEGKSNKNKSNNKSFKAIYDLNYNSTSFNFVSFVILCNIYCRQNNFNFFEIIVIESNIPKKKQWRVLIESYEDGFLFNRRFSLLPGIASLSKFCKGYIYLKDREDLRRLVKNQDIFPKDYLISNLGPKNGYDSILFKYFKTNGFSDELIPNIRSNNIVEKYLKKIDRKKIITLTFRDIIFDQSRNTTSDILRFVQYLQSKEYNIIVIPDSDNPYYFEDLKLYNNDIGFAAAYDIGIRFALYKKSMLNIFSDNGPFVLAAFSSDVNYIAFHNIDNSVLKDEFNNLNIQDLYNENGQYLWANAKQKLIHGKEDFKKLLNEFNNFFKD